MSDVTLLVWGFVFLVALAAINNNLHDIKVALRSIRDALDKSDPSR